MRMLVLAGAAASLISIGPTRAVAQEAALPGDAPAPPKTPPGPVAVNPNDPYPNPPPPQPPAAAKPKITAGQVAEAGGGVAGGLLAKGVGTAVAGPVGGFAASWIGSNLGGRAVHMIGRLFHRDKPAETPGPPVRQAAVAPPAVDASATAAEPPPAADAPS